MSHNLCPEWIHIRGLTKRVENPLVWRILFYIVKHLFDYYAWFRKKCFCGNSFGKYGSSTSKGKLKFLQSFIELHNLPFGIVINNSDRIELITDKIIQIPAGAL